jgi:16S rRNA (guanine966-N2)-methyltransferase
VETDEAARGAIRENVEAMGLFGQTRVHRRDATDLGVRPGADGPAFGLAFLDPPYANGLGETALEKLAAGGWLAPGAIVVFERGATEPEVSVLGFEPLDVRDYGAARVHFLRFEAA